MPAQPPPSRSAVPAPVRARLRLGAALLLGLLTVLNLVLAVRLYFFPSVSAVASGLVGVGFAAVALLYGLLTRAVVRQSRPGHILAAAVCAIAAVLSLSAGMAWLDWVALGLNLLAVAALLGCVPRRAARA